MKQLDASHVISYCRERNLSWDAYSRIPKALNPDFSTIEIRLPDNGRHRFLLCAEICDSLASGEVLLSIHEWSSSYEHLDLLLETILCGLGAKGRLVEFPGHLFSEQERRAAAVLMSTLSLSESCDASLIASDGSVLSVEHDDPDLLFLTAPKPAVDNIADIQ